MLATSLEAKLEGYNPTLILEGEVYLPNLIDRPIGVLETIGITRSVLSV